MLVLQYAFFQPILQLSKESSWPSLWLRCLYSFYIYPLPMYTNTRSVEVVSKRFCPRALKLLHNSSRAGHLTYVSRYVAVYQISKFFVNILVFHYSQNVFAAGWRASRAGWHGVGSQFGDPCSKTPTPEIGLQNVRAYKIWIMFNSWATGWRMQLVM